MTSIENSICEAVDILVKKQVQDAGYDRTIKGTIMEVIDATIGKYKVKYQDSSFYAYSTSSDIKYTRGSDVYVLIPANDMSGEKTILGTVSKLGINYIPIVPEESKYSIIGENLLDSPELSMCSYDTNFKVLYYADWPNEDPGETGEYTEIQLPDGKGSLNVPSSYNKIKVDDDKVQHYIRDISYSSVNSLLIKFNLRTEIPKEQRGSGNYGIIFALKHNDNLKYFIFDVNQISGNPYVLEVATPQFSAYELEAETFTRIEYIALFSNNFPNSSMDKPDDIFITNLSLQSARRLSDEEINGCCLDIITPKGTMFDRSKGINSLDIQGQLRIKGEIVNLDSQQIPFYLFREDVRVSTTHEKYCDKGGQGWYCLNEFNPTDLETSEHQPVVEWVPKYTGLFTENNEHFNTYELKYKLVAVYDNKIIEKIFSLYNALYTFQKSFTITSSEGTEFYSGGKTLLTCSIQDTSSMPIYPLTYYWGKVDSEGTFSTITNEGGLDGTYQAMLDELSTAKNAIADGEAKYTFIGSVVPSEEPQPWYAKERIPILERYIDNFDKTYTRVGGSLTGSTDDNVLYLAIRDIVKYNTFKCTVIGSTEIDGEYVEFYYGTPSIDIRNIRASDSTDYSLRVKGGDQLFQYDEDGVSPTSYINENPMLVPALTCDLLDPNGKVVQENCKARWYPHGEMIEWLDKNANPVGKDQEGHYLDDNVIVDENGNAIGYTTVNFFYDVSKMYNSTKAKNNSITVEFDYLGETAGGSTGVTLTKQGEFGTNGTKYTCLISNGYDECNRIAFIEYDYLGHQRYTMLPYKGGNNGIVTSEINTNPNSTLGYSLYMNLYQDGQKIAYTNEHGTLIYLNNFDQLITVTNVEWEILRNHYGKINKASGYTNYDYYDRSRFTVNKNSGDLKYWGYEYKPADGLGENEYNNKAEVLKVTVTFTEKENNKKNVICSFMPLIAVEISDNRYCLNIDRLEKNILTTGYNGVLYTSGGTKPRINGDSSFYLSVGKYYNSEGYNFEDYTSTEDQKEKAGFHNSDKEWVDITDIDGTTFDWSYHGGYLGNIVSGNSIALHEIDVNPFKYKDNNHNINNNRKPELSIKPKDQYNGLSVMNGLSCTVQVNGNIVMRVSFPIHMSLNRYENMFLNGWDGSHIDLNKDGGTILAPQIGAGSKDSDNSFTGVIMGEYRSGKYVTTASGKTDSDSAIGLLGFHKGERSFMINARNGMATFGKVGGGQIVLDPSEIDKDTHKPLAQIYSSDYYTITESYENGEIKVTRTPNRAGMLIDLSTPCINWGNGHFSVDQNGYLTADGGGAIGSWFISNDNMLVSSVENNQNNNNNNNRIVLDGKDRRIYTGTKNVLSNSSPGFYLGTDGLSIGSRFTVTSEGNLTATNVNLSGTITANKGRLGGWTIAENYLKGKSIVLRSPSSNIGAAIYSGTGSGDNPDADPTTSSWKNSLDKDIAGFYIGHDGISLGTVSSFTLNGYTYNYSKFRVDNQGNLVAQSAIIRGNITADTGSIGNWIIANNRLQNEDGTIYIGPSGWKYGSWFEASPSGLTINGSVDVSGSIDASSGRIGGWSIGQNTIFSGGIILNSNTGTIYSRDTNNYGWTLSNGAMSTNMITVSGGTIGGWTITSDSIGDDSDQVNNVYLQNTGSFNFKHSNSSHICYREATDGSFFEASNLEFLNISTGNGPYNYSYYLTQNWGQGTYISGDDIYFVTKDSQSNMIRIPLRNILLALNLIS